MFRGMCCYLGKQLAKLLVLVAKLADLSSYVSSGDAASTPGCPTAAATAAAWLRRSRRPLPHQFQRPFLLSVRITPQLYQLPLP